MFRICCDHRFQDRKRKSTGKLSGYDSNRLSNGTDSGYYRQPANSASHHYKVNQALKHKTAPGSTFKPQCLAFGYSNEKASRQVQSSTVQGYTIRSHHRRSKLKYPDRHDQELCQQRSKYLCNYFLFMKWCDGD